MAAKDKVLFDLPSGEADKTLEASGDPRVGEGDSDKESIRGRMDEMDREPVDSIRDGNMSTAVGLAVSYRPPR